MRLASVRRSLFTSETERTQFLHHLVSGTRDVLRAQTGLAEHENYHEFCRLLGRLKHNYQLSELVGHHPAFGNRLPRGFCVICFIMPHGGLFLGLWRTQRRSPMSKRSAVVGQ